MKFTVLNSEGQDNWTENIIIPIREGINLHVAAAVDKGRREEQQDNVTVAGMPGYALLAVFDGHGQMFRGDIASRLAAFGAEMYAVGKTLNVERVEAVAAGAKEYLRNSGEDFSDDQIDKGIEYLLTVAQDSGTDIKALCVDAIDPCLRTLHYRMVTTASLAEFTSQEINEYNQGDSPLIAFNRRATYYEPTLHNLRHRDQIMELPEGNRLTAKLGGLEPGPDIFQKIERRRLHPSNSFRNYLISTDGIGAGSFDYDKAVRMLANVLQEETEDSNVVVDALDLLMKIIQRENGYDNTGVILGKLVYDKPS